MPYLRVSLHVRVQVRTGKKPRTCPGWSFASPQIWAWMLELELNQAEQRQGTKSGFPGCHVTGKVLHQQHLIVGGLCNLYVHIPPGQASLREASAAVCKRVSSLRWLVILAFIGLLGKFISHQVISLRLHLGIRRRSCGIGTIFFFPFSFSCPLFGRGSNQC